jgi:hypothetical protein
MQTTKEVQDKVAHKTGMGPVCPKLVNDPDFYNSISTNDANQNEGTEEKGRSKE